ncbi:hypothetical protein [Acidimicrobium ferrooxidans]|nr:hypothetical protein [Acidimicrobium ferrooxidans]
MRELDAVGALDELVGSFGPHLAFGRRSCSHLDDDLRESAVLRRTIEPSR